MNRTEEPLFEIIDQQRRALTPEQTLLLAMLEDAILCAARPVTNFKQEELQRNALRWIKGDEYYAGYLFSFRSVCEELDLDSSYIRKRILSGEVVIKNAQHKKLRYVIYQGRRAEVKG